MSNFLENLVARSLSQMETVRPQVVSIFDPPPVNGGAISRASAELELPMVEREMASPIPERIGQVQSLWRGKTEQGAMAVEPLLPLGSAGSRPILPAVDATGTPSEKVQGRAADEPMAVTPFSSAKPAPNIPAEMLPGGVKRKPATVAPVTAGEVSGSKPPNEYKSHEKSVALHEPAATSSAAPRVSRFRTEAMAKASPPTPVTNKPAPMEPQEQPSGARPNVIEQKVIETIVRKRRVEDEVTSAREAQTNELRPASAARSVRIQQPGIAPIVPASIVVSPRILPAPPNDDAKEAPSVYVTIGRVEVRATVPPPVRSRPQAAPAPVMSLDEYLRQRAAGDRR